MAASWPCLWWQVCCCGGPGETDGAWLETAAGLRLASMWLQPSPISSTVTWPASGSSSRRWARCWTRSPTRCWWPSCCWCLCGDQILRGGHVWAAIIILAREVLVSGLREFLGQLRVSVPVTQIAKWKTTVQLVAIGFLIAGPAGDTDHSRRHLGRHRRPVDCGRR